MGDAVGSREFVGGAGIKGSYVGSTVDTLVAVFTFDVNKIVGLPVGSRVGALVVVEGRLVGCAVA